MSEDAEIEKADWNAAWRAHFHGDPEPEKITALEGLMIRMTARAIAKERERIADILDRREYEHEGYEENADDMIDNIVAAIRKGLHT